MTGYPVFPPYFVLVNGTGRPYAGARAAFFKAGTSTALSVYADAALQTALGATLIADANGLFPQAFADPAGGDYKVTFTTSAGALIRTLDNQPAGFPFATARTVYELAASVTPSDTSYAPGDPRRYGAKLDGSDDTAALTAAIAQQQAGGATVTGVPGHTLTCATWATITTMQPLRIDGRGMTIKCTNSTRVAFVTCKANFDIAGCTFDGWYRVVSNSTSVTQSITEARFHGNRCINATVGATNNAYYVMILNPCENVWITDNVFKDAKVAAVYVGDNTYANQDTWNKITIRGNTVEGLTTATTTASGFGFLVYGRDVVIDGNDVSGVEGAGAAYSASNGAYGIYTKCRFGRIVNNSVHGIGFTTDADNDQLIGINVKGSDRAASATPQGYGCVIANNTVRNVGVANTSGTGISCDHSDVLVNGNFLDGIGRRGIYVFDAAASTVGHNVIADNAITLADGSNENGVEVVPFGSKTQVTGNVITSGGHGVRVRTTTTDAANVIVSNNVTDGGIAVRLTADTKNLSNVIVTGNLMVAGTRGVYFDTASGGVISDVMVMDNDFSVATTAAVGGTLPTTARIRNNRGYATQNCGSASVATGTPVAHGCGDAPTVVLVTALESGPADIYVTTIGATNFTINFGGGGTKLFAWQAFTAAYYA